MFGAYWNDSMSIGIETIDKQHKMIVDNFRNLSDAAHNGTSEEYAKEMVHFLVYYAAVHFETEEKLMQQYNYPKLEMQQTEHEAFRKDIQEYRIKLENEGVSREFAIALTGKIIRWVIQHIKNHDREMGEYVRARMEAVIENQSPEVQPSLAA